MDGLSFFRTPRVHGKRRDEGCLWEKAMRKEQREMEGLKGAKGCHRLALPSLSGKCI